MARVVTNNNGNTTLTTTTPFMDRLTHEVIKETSKSLKYYIDVKRRENAFVLNPNSSALDAIPLKARFIYGTTKEYPPLYGSCHSDNDVKVYLRSFQQQQKKQSHSTSSSPEKQMCREELHFHMRSPKYSPRESQKFAELNLRPSIRSSSSCSGISGRDYRKRTPKSAFKLSHYDQEQLIDDTADILASMVKTRRSIYETNFLSQQTLPNYISRNTNPSPRQTDEQSNAQLVPLTLTHPSTELRPLTTTEPSKKPKHTTENALAKNASIMHQAKPITKGLLCEYKVSVTTGNCNGASTDAPISIKFYGTNGYTGFLPLVDSETHRVAFLKNQTDVFIIQTYHVGQLAGITIGHDRKDIRSSWFLNKLSIDDPIRDITYDIPCNAWLSSKSNDQKTMRDFQVASMISHKKHIDSDDHREEIESQSGYSTATSERTVTSNSTHQSQKNQLTKHKRTKKQRVSIGPTTVSKKPTSTDESHFNRNEFSPPPVPARQTRSPVISTASSSDAENENPMVNHNRSITPILDQSRKQSIFDRNSSQTSDTIKRHSIDQERPPARLEKRSSPTMQSPERPNNTKEKTDENDHSFFFD